MKTESRKQNAECRRLSAASRITHHGSRLTRHSGVALVITLILLSVITFMTVTFLVVSRSQHGSVVVETEAAIARLATETGRQRGLAQILVPIMASSNVFNYGLLVSTNYINAGGFTPGVSSPLNVNYDHKADGTKLTSALDWEQNIANLLFDPRPPVFFTNRLVANSNEFRFFIDLNRNGRDDPNGLLPVMSPDPNLPYYDTNGVPIAQIQPDNTLSNFFIGDLDWIGVLQHPELPHSVDNKFVSRYAYIVQPVGQTLDWNTIHNQALTPNKTKLDPNGGDFVRNQGVGTYEINLAPLLYDLNTNLYAWGGQYRYDPLGGFPPAGNAFVDAGELIAYRYATDPNTKSFTLASVSQVFGTAGRDAFSLDYIDGYGGGTVMVGTHWPQAGSPDGDQPRVTTPWAGAENPNRFYTPWDLFERAKTAPALPGKTLGFTDRLIAASTNISSYDRYTFYRLLSVIGTDTAPEPSGRMNLNNCNVDTNGYVVPNLATNFIPWLPVQFFTNAAIRLLVDAGYTVGNTNSATNILVTNYVGGILVTNIRIPIWPTNFYTPSVHRLMQVAANLYDATANRTFGITSASNGYPSVFRPLFLDPPVAKGGQAGLVFITGYTEPTDGEMSNLVYVAHHDLSSPTDRPVKARDMVYGIPLVIGARKGYPNFNEFAMHMMVQITRKLQYHRPLNSTTLPVNEIDQMFVVGVSNVFGVEAWNSYRTPFPRNLQIMVAPDLSVLVTNLETHKMLNPAAARYQPLPTVTNIAANAWSGYDPAYEQYSFRLPFGTPLAPTTNIVVLPNSTYRSPAYGPAPDQFVPLTGNFERTSPAGTNLYLPNFQITLKSRLRFALVDTVANRIVDYVNPGDLNVVNLTNVLISGGQCDGPYRPDGSVGSMWCPTRMYGAAPNNVTVPTYGIQNQIEVSMGHVTADWNNAVPIPDKDAAIRFFKGQFLPGYIYSSNTFSAPYQPFRNIFLVTSWQANDPLVHYTVGDLTDPTHTNTVVDRFSSTSPRPTDNLGKVNARYEPWGGNPSGRSSSGTPQYELTVKDPLMLRSDYWDFPTNRFPNPGWVGQVHRGTPWQTVYLKSFSNSVSFPTGQSWFANWQKWTGNGQLVTNFGQFPTNLIPLHVPGTTIGVVRDAFFTHPTNDWHLLDLFTTAISDNATRGQLSINQPNLAAWSAVLGGVIVLPDIATPPYPINPAGTYDPAAPPPLVTLVNGINKVRSMFPGGVFRRLSDILAVPELTVGSIPRYVGTFPNGQWVGVSPYLNLGDPGTTDPKTHVTAQQQLALSDAAYERLPQQILGLLKCDQTPRFVIYAFGQTLKPAPHGIVSSGPFAGLCTNYQIMAEAATRSVIRIEGTPANPRVVPESYNVLPPD